MSNFGKVILFSPISENKWSLEMEKIIEDSKLIPGTMENFRNLFSYGTSKQMISMMPSIIRYNNVLFQ